MKRTISLVIALTLSFAMMFGSVAKAEEIKVPISVSTLEPNKLEAVKVLAAKTNKADSPVPQAKASELGLKKGKQSDGVYPQFCNVPCNGKPGYWNGSICVQCITQNNAAN